MPLIRTMVQRLAPRSLLAVLALAASALATGCGDAGDRAARATPAPTVVAADTDKGGAFWHALSAGRKLDLAELCRGMAASEARDRFGNEAYGSVADADIHEIARAITAHYAEGDAEDRIGGVCATAARQGVSQVVLALDSPHGRRVKGATATLSGHVFPPEAEVSVRRTRKPGAGAGWLDPQRGRVDRHTGRFTARLEVARRGENDFRIDGRRSGMRPAVEVTYLIRQKTPAQRAAERATARRERAAEREARTVRLSGNGGKYVGVIDIPADSTLRWTNDGSLFQLFDKQIIRLFVNSDAHSGETDAPRGHYRHVLVNAIGNWTITITSP